MNDFYFYYKSSLFTMNQNILILPDNSFFDFDKYERRKNKYFQKDLNELETKLVSFIINACKEDQEFINSEFFPFNFNDLIDVRIMFKVAKRKIEIEFEFQGDESYIFTIELINSNLYKIYTEFFCEDKLIGYIEI